MNQQLIEEHEFQLGVVKESYNDLNSGTKRSKSGVALRKSIKAFNDLFNDVKAFVAQLEDSDVNPVPYQPERAPYPAPEAKVEVEVPKIEPVIETPTSNGRKIISISSSSETSERYSTMFALCDDGSLWRIVHKGDMEKYHSWQRMKSIPPE